MADRVTINFIAGAGDTRQWVCVIDDYDRRLADGEFVQYLSERAYPVLARDWRPDFTEVDRTVERGFDAPEGGA